MKKIIIILLPFFIVQTCIAQKNNYIDKAVIKPENVYDVINFEKQISPYYQTNAPEGLKWYKYKSGKKKILILAPHATAQIREGEIKEADGGTGSIALELNKLCDVPILYTTFLSPSDPNYYDKNEFKDTLAKILDQIHPIFVIDLHGSHPYRPYDVDLGTLNGKSFLNKQDLLDSLIVIFKRGGLEYISSNCFAAEVHQTDTKFVFNHNIPCVQLEINSNYLSADTNNANNIYGQKTAQLLDALIKFIDVVNKE